MNVLDGLPLLLTFCWLIVSLLGKRLWRNKKISKQGLFRANALKAQANKLDGDVYIAQAVSITILTACLLLAVIMAPRQSVVSDVYVKDGEAIEQGQPLMLLSTHEYLASGGNLNRLMENNLVEQAELLKARVRHLFRQSEFKEHELEQRTSFHTNQINDLEERHSLAEERLSMNESRLNSFIRLTESGLLATEGRSPISPCSIRAGNG